MPENEELPKTQVKPPIASQETPLELFIRTSSEAGRPVVDETAQKAGLVIQIIGYPRPPQNASTDKIPLLEQIAEFNREAEAEGNLLVRKEPPSLQIILGFKTPSTDPDQSTT